MNTLEFLRRVLPSQGTYAIFHTEPGGAARPKTWCSDDIQAIASKGDELNAAGRNVYFAVNSFKESRRTQDNLLCGRALYHDIDCGKNDAPFDTAQDALRWLKSFVREYELPMPVIVFTGNGLHTYWVFDRDLTASEWNTLATAWKAMMHEYIVKHGKMFVDMSVPSDAAQVLRAPGWTNRGKHGAENKIAKVLLPNASFDPEPVTYEFMEQKLSGFIDTMAGAKVGGKRKSKLADLGTYEEMPPADPTLIYEKCKQVQACVDNQDKVDYNRWFLLLGVANFCEDPEETAKGWSSQYAKYDEQETLRKLGEWSSTTGPSTCAAFDNANPKGCAKCPFAKKVTTPVQLGTRRQEQQPDAAAPTLVSDIQLPRKFRRTTQGIVIEKEGVEIVISDVDIYPHSEGYDADRLCHVYRFVWKHAYLGWKYLVLPLEAFTSGAAHSTQRFITECARQGFYIPYKEKGDSLQMFMREYMEQLKKQRPPINSATHMGWTDDKMNKFVLGDTLFAKESDGTISENTAPLSGTMPRHFVDACVEKGTLDSWTAGTELLEDYKMTTLKIGLVLSLAAPLMKIIGIDGCIFNLYGKSGAGKSLSQHVAMSMWGNPKSLYSTARDTNNAMFSQMALLGNILYSVDEAGMIPPKTMGDLAYSVSQGSERNRLDRNSQLREVKRFSTLVQLSANKPMSALLTSSGDEADGQLYRLIDIHVDPHPKFAANALEGPEIYSLFLNNYGVAGRAYIKRLIELGPDNLRIMFNDVKKGFEAKYNFEFKGPERVWMAGIMAGELGSTVASDMALIKCSMRDAIEKIISQIPALRNNIQENVEMSTPMSVVSRYLNEISDSTATVLTTSGRVPMVTTPPRGLRNLLARVDLYKNRPSGDVIGGTLTLEKKSFKDWLSGNGSDIRTVEEYARDNRLDVTPSSGRVVISKDVPDIRMGQVRVMCINLDCPDLESILDDARSTSMVPPKQFKVIKGDKP